MIKNIIIKKITAKDTRPLRKSILRPNKPEEKLVYYGDDIDTTLHIGAFDGDKLVAIASVCNESKPNENDIRAWRLRGMGVLPEYRRNNIGDKILHECLEHVKQNNGYIWCNARLVAVEFYKSNGFSITSDLFEIEDIGPHYNMEKHFDK
jgi:predicted GNAT family N-acyltransferase